MAKLIKAGLLVLVMAVSIKLRAQTLTAGMPAPELKVAWLKGKPLSRLETGKVYVVEFWATWCAPCRASIPHLTELQEKYKDKVTIIGVSVLERNPDYAAVFVQGMGDKMNYSVAKDELGQPGLSKGYMAHNWLDASGFPYIPWVFVIGKDGKIAYVGGSGELDAELEKAVKGN